MPLTAKAINTWGYISITLMMVLLLLLWFRLVPESLAIPFFIVALLLFVVRIVLRIRLAKLERLEYQSRKQFPQ